MELLVDGKSVETMLPPYRLRLETHAWVEGDHELLLRTSLGEQVFLSEPRPLRVDRTSPILVSRSPVSGERHVPAGQVIRASFSEALDPATIHGGSARLTAESRDLAGDVELSIDGRALTIHPRVRLPRDVAVHVVLDSSVTDLAGNPIQREEDGWSWTMPGFLPLGNSFSTDSPAESTPAFPEMLIPSSGLPIVAWADTGSRGVFVRHWTGEAWEFLGTPMKNVDASRYLNAQLNTEGHPVIAWIDDLASEIHVRYWTGSEWRTMGDAIRGLPPYLWALSMRTDGAGQWFMSFASRQEILVWKWDGASWGRIGLFPVAETSSVMAAYMELDAAGQPLVIWGERDVMGVDRYREARWEGGEWVSNPSALNALGMWSWGVGVAGRPLAATLVETGALIREWNGVSWSSLGTSFQERFPGGAPAAVHRFVEDPSGALVVLLGESESAGQPDTLHFRRFVEGDWAPLDYVLRPSRSSGMPRFGVTPAGRFIVARVEAAHAPPTHYFMQVYISND
ncbi:Ig-like domain-containing protein [Myxococcus sp. K38C18041901]|uniref:Ig-like domain-containing protein n=1 Tax=Myxococcus guangdongensis TaxID=2906760 RepID=UPI0020A833F8|nr:Ig-like domain-containing protein [Myxococcus guangdongensis]MCP3065495.1 Ig-like domain-containing protein [Myxococcus guangdongensis]